jgi:hypothetical protein
LEDGLVREQNVINLLPSEESSRIGANVLVGLLRMLAVELEGINNGV